MNCLIPHDSCPLLEELEDHLSCSDCDWKYSNPRRRTMQDVERPGILVILDEIQHKIGFVAEKRANGPIRE